MLMSSSATRVPVSRSFRPEKTVPPVRWESSNIELFSTSTPLFADRLTGSIELDRYIGVIQFGQDLLDLGDVDAFGWAGAGNRRGAERHREAIGKPDQTLAAGH